MGYSSKWKTWKAEIDLKTCLNCRMENGKIQNMGKGIIFGSAAT